MLNKMIKWLVLTRPLRGEDCSLWVIFAKMLLIKISASNADCAVASSGQIGQCCRISDWAVLQNFWLALVQNFSLGNVAENQIDSGAKKKKNKNNWQCCRDSSLAVLQKFRWIKDADGQGGKDVRLFVWFPLIYFFGGRWILNKEYGQDGCWQAQKVVKTRKEIESEQHCTS